MAIPGEFKRGVLVGLGLLVLVTSGLQAASREERLFAEKWADHLPGWCLYTQLLPDKSYGLYGHPGFQAQREKLQNIFGATLKHLHHYCFGLADAYEASLIEEESLRKSRYYQAVGEFDYVLDRAPDSFVLKPEIFVQRGAALEMTGLYVDAVYSYGEAVRLKSDYEPAYVGLGNCFEELGDLQEALAIIDKGLQQIPGSEALLAMRAELASLIGE